MNSLVPLQKIKMVCLFSCLSALSSCCMYKTKFDCPPSEGVRCVSVTKLEKMIVETSKGEDLFIGCVPKLADFNNNPACNECEDTVSNEPFQRRVWVKGCDKPCYIYFSEDLSCEQQ